MSRDAIELVSTRSGDGLAVTREALDARSECQHCGAWTQWRYWRGCDVAIACDLRCAELRWHWESEGGG